MSATAMDRERNGDGRRQLDGDGRCDGNSMVRDGAMATRCQWMTRTIGDSQLCRLRFDGILKKIQPSAFWMKATIDHLEAHRFLQ